MIDNYDSFTYNIVQYLGELGEEVRTCRNDKIGIDAIGSLMPDGIVISPGPCTPDQAGISMEVIREFGGRIPVFGICLGHQSVGQVYGARVSRAKRVMHGKTSLIHHKGVGVFRGLKSPFTATRYHSLVIDDLPDCLEVTAWTLDERGEFDEVMAVRHREMDVEGVQFHPESILSEQGHDLLGNFLKRSRG